MCLFPATAPLRRRSLSTARPASVKKTQGSGGKETLSHFPVGLRTDAETPAPQGAGLARGALADFPPAARTGQTLPSDFPHGASGSLRPAPQGLPAGLGSGHAPRPQGACRVRALPHALGRIPLTIKTESSDGRNAAAACHAFPLFLPCRHAGAGLRADAVRAAELLSFPGQDGRIARPQARCLPRTGMAGKNRLRIMSSALRPTSSRPHAQKSTLSRTVRLRVCPERPIRRRPRSTSCISCRCRRGRDHCAPPWVPHGDRPSGGVPRRPHSTTCRPCGQKSCVPRSGG